jgi:Holliday junction resolvase RusA-like endonuclease
MGMLIEPILVLSFTVYGKPISWKRVADYIDPATGQTRKIADKGGRTWRSEIKDKFRATVFEASDAEKYLPHDGPVEMDIVAGFQIPAGKPQWWKARAEEGTIPFAQIPDADNIMKNVGDALEGIAFTNDSRIFKASCRKVWTWTPKTDITLIFYPEISRANYDVTEKGMP